MSNLRWHRTSSSPRLPHAVGESWEERGVGEILLDSPKPDETWREYTKLELRYRMLQKAHPEEAERMLDLGQRQVERRYAEYAEMASRAAEDFAVDARMSEFAASSNRA